MQFDDDNFVSYFPQRVPGVDSDDETPFAIAGIRYKNGIGIHPKSDEIPACLTLSLSADHSYNFHAVFGKTRKVNKNKVIFSIVGDGKVLWKSEEMTAGEVAVADVSVVGISELKIIVESSSDGIAYDCSGIADAFLYSCLS